MSLLDDSRDDREYGDGEFTETIEYDAPYEEIIAPMAVHQCNVCNKIFMSFKGLQQHSVIHTDTKPFVCDVCGRGFRFKSNMFEHRTVHTGYTPHLCPFCGKQFRLKGNMKKHMRVHVTNKEELEAAYRPYSSNRRSSAIIPDNALVIRGSPSPFFGQEKRRSVSKLQLGKDASRWVSMICKNELLPIASQSEKLLRSNMRMVVNQTFDSLMNDAKIMEFESFHCPLCKMECFEREECEMHLWAEHGKKADSLNSAENHYCEKCMRSFSTVGIFLQHQSYHSRVQLMIKNRELECNPPEISFSELCFKMLTNVSSSSSELQKSMFPTGLSTESNLNDPGAISLSITEEINNNNMGASIKQEDILHDSLS